MMSTLSWVCRELLLVIYLAVAIIIIITMSSYNFIQIYWKYFLIAMKYEFIIIIELSSFYIIGGVLRPYLCGKSFTKINLIFSFLTLCEFMLNKHCANEFETVSWLMDWKNCAWAVDIVEYDVVIHAHTAHPYACIFYV